MIDEHDVREMLLRRANTVPTSKVDAPKASRRARRRLLANGAVGVLATAAIAVATFAGVDAVRTAPIPADDPSENLGIFAPVAGRILFENAGVDRGYGPGFWAVDPSGPSDTTEGPSVADGVVSTLVPLELDGEPLGWSSDGTELLLMRSVGDGFFPEQSLSILHADGSETRLNEDPMGISDATISPDGTRVVFAGQYDLAGLFVIDAEGGQPVQLPIAQAADGAGSPTFSPDGTQIAFLAGNRDAEVWVANADGTDAHEILADEPTLFRGVSGPVWSPAGDRLAIGVGTHRRSGGSIYTFAPDGSDVTEVIVGGSSPYWSPDGSQIAYTIQCDVHPTFTCVQFDPQAGSSPPGLAIADADGSNVRAFGFATSGPWHPAGSAQVNEPTPTPSESFPRVDGEVLSFTGVPFETPGDLVAVDPETGDERVLVEDLDDVYRAAWSADRRWVAFETPGSLWVVDETLEPRRLVDGPELWIWSSTGAELLVKRGLTLSVVDPSTGLATELASTLGDLSAAPAWSPDETKIVFGAGAGTIDSIDARTGDRSRLVQLPAEEFDSVEGMAWSPDGSRLAIYNDLEPGEGRLLVLDADGSDIRVLAEGENVFGFAWSPDGTRMVFTDDRGAVFVAPVDGSTASLVASLPIDGDATNPVWSPDGSQVAFAFEPGRQVPVTFPSDRAFVINADGSGDAEPIDDLTYASWNGGSFCSSCDWWNAYPISYRDPLGGAS